MPRFLVVLDVDSTLIENEVIDLLAAAAGSEEKVSAITASAMRGDLDFAESLRARVATLAGLPETELRSVQQRVEITQGAQELIEGVQTAGGRVAAVSGGFHDIIDPVAAGLRLDRWRANCLEIEDGRLTGRIRGRVIDAAAKAAALSEWAELYSVPSDRTIAIGDGANDISMLNAAALSIGFDAKPSVRDAARIVMDTRDLSQVLPLLGLRG